MTDTTASTSELERPSTPLEAPEPTRAGPQPGPRARPAVDRPGRRAALARRTIALLRRALPHDAAISIGLVGDSAGVPVMGDATTSDAVVAPAAAAAVASAARARVLARDPDAVAHVIWPPTPDTLAEAYLRGELEIEGDVMAAVRAGEALDLRRLDWTSRRRLLRWGAELRRDAPPVPAVGRRARLRGRPHSRARDVAAVRFHYDVGNDFYRLWLDRRMTYSCAYFGDGTASDPAAALDEAQEAKLDLVCRKLALERGRRLLDIGCGWGSLILFAAERYGVTASGITLSQEQARWTTEAASARGLSERVQAEVRDYRDAEGAHDALASVGMFEHVGRANHRRYFQAAYRALRPGGLFLNHAIASAGRTGPSLRPRLGSSHFVDRYVFPDGELAPLDETLAAARGAGFEILDVQSLRPHYALTLAAWVSRLEAHWPAATAAVDEEIARTWRLYLSAARLGFERGDLEVYQVLLARPAETGPAPRPGVRPWW